MHYRELEIVEKMISLIPCTQGIEVKREKLRIYGHSNVARVEVFEFIFHPEFRHDLSIPA